MISCGECGEVPECEHCSIKLTYHSANNRLMCHYCGYSRRVPYNCPKCAGTLNFIGSGTQKVEEELRDMFPQTDLIRMDADTISAKNTHEKILSKFEKDNVPILLGTQMVAKGLDFSNVTLVGVLDADIALYNDNFRASERTFSLITQVIGRAGRGEKKGRAIIQTHTPQNEVIEAASTQDYDSFYEGEIALRRARNLPPFRQIVELRGSSADETELFKSLSEIKSFLTRELGNFFEILGPAPCNIVKVNGRYRFRIFIYGNPNKHFRYFLAEFLKNISNIKTNKGISFYVDVDPL